MLEQGILLGMLILDMLEQGILLGLLILGANVLDLAGLSMGSTVWSGVRRRRPRLCGLLR